MKNVTLVLLGVTFFMVGTAFAAPIIDMYDLEKYDCRDCHDDTGVLKETNHEMMHDSEFDSCWNCHESEFDNCWDCHVIGPKKLGCMELCCHGEDYIGVTNHHDFDEMEIDDCFLCHEQGVPRGR